LDRSYQDRIENIGKHADTIRFPADVENKHTWAHVEMRKRNLEEFIKEFK
jgi:hypothetical protein